MLNDRMPDAVEATRRGGRRLLFPCGILLLLLCGVTSRAGDAAAVAAAGSSQEPGARLNLRPILAGKYEVTLPDGAKIRFADLPGLSTKDAGKPVLIDFWATWCAACVADIRHLTAIHEKYKTEGLVVIGLTTEKYAEAITEVKTFAAKYGVQYQLAFAPEALFRAFHGPGARNVIPQKYIFDADGVLVRRIVGFKAGITPRLLDETVRMALEKSPAQ
ncbi:MAG: TlpA family protein disulfide reductase [Blastocatellia bacterium]